MHGRSQGVALGYPISPPRGSRAGPSSFRRQRASSIEHPASACHSSFVIGHSPFRRRLAAAPLHLLHPVARPSGAIRPDGLARRCVRCPPPDTSVDQTFFRESLRIALQSLRSRSSPLQAAAAHHREAAAAPADVGGASLPRVLPPNGHQPAQRCPSTRDSDLVPRPSRRVIPSEASASRGISLSCRFGKRDASTGSA